MARGLDPFQAASSDTPGVAAAGTPDKTPAVGHGRPFLAHDGPLFFAHRGGALLAPENTLVAYERGLSFGADALELDVHSSRDGEIVVIHDATLDRTTNGSGPVGALTLDELRRLDAGYRFTPDGGRSFPFRGRGITIPTLREVLTTFPQARVNLDLKEADAEGERRLWALIQELEAEDRMLVGSFSLLALARFRQLCGGRLATSAAPPEIRNFLLAALSRTSRWLRPAYDALQVPETWRALRIVSPTTIAVAHRLGLAMHVWTIDDRPTMDRLLAWGVDGLMSDRPDLLAEALAARRT
ncbi:MAG: glycerophosphodiester phosphodiesterase [Ktedonobacterales bacterium]|nr:glycerophosphodiester phosphodiesterase [Ktedonobacterales bacterium]